MNYKYVYGRKLDQLERKVNNSIHMGYKPVGSLSIEYLERDGKEEVKYIQAMELVKTNNH
jgi:hypothetical protein